MALVRNIYEKNFLEYASYVIKDRAIPHINDGLKPVQRRILHCLIEKDDGKFHKVANIVGECMKYHPHGDSSIYGALVNLANKDLFIEKQGNFGDPITGDPASAARYIECRILPFAKKIFYSPKITQFEDSYDGRNKEPVTFPCKLPLVVIQGAEGIAVGMATKILPHNLKEVIEACQSSLRNEPFQLLPDFISGGYVDVSEYGDGLGKVLCRANFDVAKDGKRIIIREIPFGTTTESLINSIENAAKKNKIKVAAINDFTTEDVEIEIKLARGVHADEVIDSLYAYTDCENSISVNLLVIKDNLPAVMTITEVIKYHSKQLVAILTAELKLERAELIEKIHKRTLERIFIEERIYKKIETKKTKEAVITAVIKGFEPFADIIQREVTVDDVDYLLRIPIRRISLYDINKAKAEMDLMNARIKEIDYHLKNIVQFAIDYLEDLKKGFDATVLERKTKVIAFDQVDVKQAAKQDLAYYYDKTSGYIGTNVKSGKELFKVSPFDKILVITKNGFYRIIKVAEKDFVDKGLLFAGIADKDNLDKTIFNVLYKQKSSGATCLKRFKIEKFIVDKVYPIVPENDKILKLTTKSDWIVHVKYEPAPRLKKLEELFNISDYIVKGSKASGVRLTTKKVASVKFAKKK